MLTKKMGFVNKIQGVKDENMISFAYGEIRCEGDIYDFFKKNIVDERFWNVSLCKKIYKMINWRCVNGEPLIFEIEEPYYDKDYLSTYYLHFSQKFFESPKKSIRLHFLRGEEYFGFVVLRANENGTHIGRSYLRPSLLLREPCELILGEHSCNLAGERVTWQSFPYMEQDGDFDVCAHVAVWSVLRYYGNKYRNFQNVTMGDIVSNTEAYLGRTVPSGGLNVKQVADLFSTFGHSPIIRRPGDYSHSLERFHNELVTYIESGIPFVGFISNRQHAISVIGHHLPDFSMLNDELIVEKMSISWQEDEFSGNQKGKVYNFDLIDYASLINGFVVMDDNNVPFSSLYDNMYCANIEKEKDENHTVLPFYSKELDFAIIPLHNNMYLSYEAAYQRFLSLYAEIYGYKEQKAHLISYVDNDGQEVFEIVDDDDLKCRNEFKEYRFGWADERKVFRLFMTSSNSLKEAFFSRSSTVGFDDLTEILRILNMPKFVWCVELSTEKELEEGLVSGFLVMDATAGSHKTNPWILVQGRDIIYVADSSDAVFKQNLVTTHPFTSFHSNLVKEDPLV